MPVTFEFDDGIVVLRMTGEYLLVEVRIALTAALDDAEPRPVYGLLVDLTQSESISTRTFGDVTSIVVPAGVTVTSDGANVVNSPATAAGNRAPDTPVMRAVTP